MAMQSKSEPELYQVAWIILAAARNLHVGKIKLAQFLKGSKAKDVTPIAGEVVYGGLMWYDISTIEGFIDQLERIGLIQRKIIQGYEREYPILELTDAGKLVLAERKKIPLQIIKIVKPITAGETEKKTLELFKKGRSISEIALDRNLALSTIYTHISKLIACGYLSSSNVVSEEVIRKVADAAQTLPEPTVAKVKELVPEVSYEEIRCVLAGMKNEQGKTRTKEE